MPTTELRGAMQQVSVSAESLRVRLEDGRRVSVPLAWYPRLVHASPAERNKWCLIARGEGVHWPDLDEDISLENILIGQPSGESQRSFQQWLSKRAGKANKQKSN